MQQFRAPALHQPKVWYRLLNRAVCTAVRLVEMYLEQGLLVTRSYWPGYAYLGIQSLRQKSLPK